MKVHCNYDNDGNCYYPECWEGCNSKIMKLNLFQYIKYKYYLWKMKKDDEKEKLD
ncbi:hypothetical protein LCGC14_0224810 [marine sediment metagenome]|uniref:Uncharacterized protein n=1 Tax=marine sediment metagenome TaxID=412755 RepID=A0A0F9UTU9_9ZZZZ